VTNAAGVVAEVDVVPAVTGIVMIPEVQDLHRESGHHGRSLMPRNWIEMAMGVSKKLRCSRKQKPLAEPTTRTAMGASHASNVTA
jgi:hypothetical protein